VGYHPHGAYGDVVGSFHHQGRAWPEARARNLRWDAAGGHGAVVDGGDVVVVDVVVDVVDAVDAVVGYGLRVGLFVVRVTFGPVRRWAWQRVAACRPWANRPEVVTH
jgi:hypothetical protein